MPALAVLLLGAGGPAQTFRDVTPGAGLSTLQLPTQEFGAGSCAADFDGDGVLDLAIAGPPGTPLRLLAGRGGMTFADRTAGSGLGTAAVARGVLAADIDNDGDQDLLVCNWRSPANLFVNDGSGHFVDEAGARGLTHVSSNFSASFGDYDRDGWLDLYLGNHAGPTNNFGEPNILYRNLGAGVFVDVTAAAGVGDPGWTFAAPFVDFDEDGWPDLYCVNDKGTSQPPNELYRNNGDGTFTPIGAAVNADLHQSGMGVDFVDVFGDGGVDLYCTDTPPDHAFLCFHPATGRYVNETWRRGLQGLGVGWAAHWWDFDNDAHQDLHVVHFGLPDQVYRNPGTGHAGGTWSEVAGPLGLGQLGAKYTCVIADFDDDGGLDVLQRYNLSPALPPTAAASLRRNEVVRGHWLRLALRGTQSNRDGIGARVELWAGGKRQRQHARSGIGYLGGDDRRLHFGLGSAARVDRLTVRWPSGQVQHVIDAAGDRTLALTEPSLTLRAPALVGQGTWLDLAVDSDAGLPFALALAFQGQPGTRLPDGNTLPIVFDGLASYTLFDPGNALLSGNHGTLDAAGRAAVRLQVPNYPWLLGVSVYATAVTFDWPTFPLVRTVFPRAVRVVIE